MKRFAVLLIIISLLIMSCSSLMGVSQSDDVQSVTLEPVRVSKPSETPESTATIEPSPTIIFTPTLQPTPIGGQKLTVAYLGYDCESVNSEQCIMISDFFSNKVLHRLPLSNEATSISLSWSPDGRYLLYCDVLNNIMHVMLFDMNSISATEIDTHIYMKPTSESGMVTHPYPNHVYPMRWSPDSKYIAYGLHPYYFSVYSIENEKGSLFPSTDGDYYWLDDCENLVEVSAGVISNVKTGKQTKVTRAYFYDVSVANEEYIISRKGEEPNWKHEVYLLPYIKDFETLEEEGISAILENEFLFAHAEDNEWRDTSLHIVSLVIQEDQVIFSGTLTRTNPYESQSFTRFESMDDTPFLIEIDDENGYFRDNETLLMISPDETMYFTMDTIWDEKQNRSSLLHSYSMADHEKLYTYDLHGMAEESHDITYSRYHNLAFYWEE